MRYRTFVPGLNPAILLSRLATLPLTSLPSFPPGRGAAGGLVKPSYSVRYCFRCPLYFSQREGVVIRPVSFRVVPPAIGGHRLCFRARTAGTVSGGVKNIIDGPIICIAAYTLSRKKCAYAYFRSKGKFLKGEIIDFCKVMRGFGRKGYGIFFFRRCAYCLSRVSLSESEKETRPVPSTSCRATSSKSLLFSHPCK
ncbi:MAG: hypothetical protein A4E69_00260 [Syntrophus sp. PtaB.Bin138]|nr:MAG: hypothetical protein A4E69_00260 [Syntrophus sp. PtaB.Bin138]